MTRPTYSILDSFKFISAVTAGDMRMVLDVFADNPDAWRWREDRDDDYSVLHHAIAAKQPAMVDLLIRKGALLELGAKGEMKPLMLAARNGDAESVALLLEAGADAAAKASDGRTAADYSLDRKAGDAETALIQKYIAEAAADPARGRIIKSKIGQARVGEMKEVFQQGAGKNLRASTARFRKKPVPLP